MKVVLWNLRAGSGHRKNWGAHPRSGQQWRSRQHGVVGGAPPQELHLRSDPPMPRTGTGWRVLEPDSWPVIPRWESPTEAPALEILPFSLKPACVVILTSPSSSSGSWC